MTIDENKEVLKRAIILIDQEIKENNNVVLIARNGLNAQRHQLENYKLIDLKNLLQKYLRLYSYNFSTIFDNDNENNGSISLKIEILNQMLNISKKIYNFKFRYWLYNININNIFENFRPEFPSFLEKLDKAVVNKIQELKILKKQKNTLDVEKNNYKPMNIDYDIIELKRKEIIDQANSKEFYSHDLYGSYQTIFNELQNLLNNDIKSIEVMKKLKNASATAIARLSITDRTKLSDKEKQNINWIIGAYEKAYRIYEKKYNNPSEILNYTTAEMIKYSNKLIIEYMINNKHIYQTRIDNFSELNVYDILSENIWRMSFEEIKLVYKRILEEYTKEPYRKYDYYTLQNNFILAIFKIFKSRKFIKKDTSLTPEIKNKICNVILEDKLVIEDEKGKTL